MKYSKFSIKVYIIESKIKLNNLIHKLNKYYNKKNHLNNKKFSKRYSEIILKQ